MKGQIDKEISEAGGMLNYNKGLDCHIAWKYLTFPNPEIFPQNCNLYCPGLIQLNYKPTLWDPDRNAHMAD